MTKKKIKAKPLPAGEYTGKMTKIRKARGKPFYRMELTLSSGVKLVSILPFQPEKDHD